MALSACGGGGDDGPSTPADASMGDARVDDGGVNLPDAGLDDGGSGGRDDAGSGGSRDGGDQVPADAAVVDAPPADAAIDPGACVPGTAECTGDGFGLRVCGPDAADSAGFSFGPRVPCLDGFACNAGVCSRPACISPELYLVVDRSSSMTGARYEFVSEAIVDFAQVNGPWTNMGLRMFPASNGDTCGAQDVVALGIDNGQAIATGLIPPSADAQTPLAAALSAMGPRFGDPNDGQYVILLTDGDETCAGDGQAPVEEAAKLARLGIDTFVIGVSTQANVALLDEIARAGRTGQARLVRTGGELTAAFNEIFTTVTGCACGDNLLSSDLGEVCDDGNRTIDDGCSSLCEVELGWTCEGVGANSCAPICGDGLVRGNEDCDDDNLDADDGCSAQCEVEAGFACNTPGQPCLEICGDGLVVGGEDCDDRNTDSGDGCSRTCAIEEGFTCALPGAVCEPTCGDGLRRGAEVFGGCDDGDTDPGDGCSATCEVEEGWACAGTPSLCTFSLVRQVDGGSNNICAVLDDGSLRCWGNNSLGHLGLGDTNHRGDEAGEMGDALPAVDLGTGRTVEQVSVGATHTCALLDNGAVKCWGGNGSGQLGLGDRVQRGDGPDEMGNNLPAVDLGTNRTVAALTSGRDHNCALFTDGSVKCWGDNNSGELGLGASANRGDGAGEMGNNLPTVNLGTGRTAVAISAGTDFTCAILDTGAVKCWGRNSSGQLGYGDTENRGRFSSSMGDGLPAVNLGADRTAVALATGFDHTCAILDNDAVKCWGDNFDGQLGLGDSEDRGDGPGEMGGALPEVALGSGRTPVSLVAGGFHNCVLLDNQDVKCWGEGFQGQLGLGNNKKRGDQSGEMGNNLPAVNLGLGLTAAAITTGFDFSCAHLDNGALKCWGENDQGQLGLGDTENRGDRPGETGDALPIVIFSTTP